MTRQRFFRKLRRFCICLFSGIVSGLLAVVIPVASGIAASRAVYTRTEDPLPSLACGAASFAVSGLLVSAVYISLDAGSTKEEEEKE